VVTTKLSQEYALYRGNPAEVVRELPTNLGVFQRVGRQAQVADEMERWAGLSPEAGVFPSNTVDG